ncbi:MAG TPA: DUF2185 domain-containing protein [Allosphingosinicella sp.]|nr:DUF2185 domain-containing protein [Allosphingosinicella sp.]
MLQHLKVAVVLLALAALPARAPTQPAEKQYRLSVPPERMQRLVETRQGGIASDKVTVDGRPVGYMYRAAPHNPLDSGWRFLAGDEDAAFMAEAANHAVFAVNTIANHDPAILPYLDAPVGSAFFRDGARFVPDPQGAPGS